MGAGGRIAQEHHQVCLYVVGDHVLPPAGLDVGLVPVEPDDVDQEALGKPVFAHHARGQPGLDDRDAFLLQGEDRFEVLLDRRVEAVKHGDDPTTARAAAGRRAVPWRMWKAAPDRTRSRTGTSTRSPRRPGTTRAVTSEGPTLRPRPTLVTRRAPSTGSPPEATTRSGSTIG